MCAPHYISPESYRTMQTAVGVFGGESYTDGVSAPPLMVEDAVHSGRPAVSSFNCPPFLAVETCREHLVITCTKEHIFKRKFHKTPVFVVSFAAPGT